MKTTIKSIVAAALCAVGLSAFAEESASNEIWYTATAKLAEVTGTGTTSGLHKEVFTDAVGKTLTMTSHTWEETTGKGVITFDGGIATVGGNAFRSCSALSSITIPASVTSIGKQAFYSCYNSSKKTGLTEVTFAEGSKLETIGESAFNGCKVLSSITIPASVTSIGQSAFSGCSALSSITISASVTSIGKQAFYGCTKLETVTFAEGSKLDTIGESAFYNCKILSSITIQASVTSIGNFAFQYCYALESINIPASVTSFGQSPFNGCTGLEAISVDAGNPVFSSPDGCNAIIETAKNTLIQGCKNTVIPESVKIIGTYAFQNMATLESIDIPASVTSISSCAFQFCDKLKSVTIPASSVLESLGSNAFGTCKALESINIPASVTSLEDYTFNFCSNLKSVIVNWAEAEKIVPINPSKVFKDVPEDMTLIVPAGTESLYAAATGWSTYKDKIVEAYLVSGVAEHGSVSFDKTCFPADSYTAPTETVTVTATPEKGYLLKSLVWNDGTDHDITEAKSFTMPLACVTVTAVFEEAPQGSEGNPWKIGATDADTVVAWTNGTGKLVIEGTGAMMDFKSSSSTDRPWLNDKNAITTVEIKSGVTHIGKNAFYGCTKLETVTFAEGSKLEAIGESAFDGCKVLSSITIPASVTSIGNNAFDQCTKLTEVTFAEGSKLGTIGESAFYRCRVLSSITIPAFVTSIGTSAFQSCSALESISVDAKNSVYSSPDGCNAIIETATHKLIQGCKSTVIPESVEIIGENAFWMISTLESITIPANVKSIGNSAFYQCCDIMSRTGLTTVTIAEGSKLETIGEQAFNCCLFLSSPITIPASVTSIGNKAFGQSKLTEVTFAEGSKLGTIGEEAFYSCSALSSITIPASVTSIGNNAFQFCSGLTDLVVKATAVPTLANAKALPSSNKGFKVYVPYGKGADYQAANIWSGVSDKIFEAYMVDVKPTAHGAVAVSEDCFPTNEYTTASETVTVTVTPDEGYQLKSLVWNDGTDHDITEAKSFTMPLANVTLTAEFEEIPKVPVGENAYMQVADDGSCLITGTGSVTNLPSGFDRNSITKMVVEDGITEIGARFFKECLNLNTVTLGKDVAKVGEKTFLYCMSLETVEIDNPDFDLSSLDGAINYHTAVNPDGSLYPIPNVTVAGCQQTLEGKANLTDANWADLGAVVPGKAMEDYTGYHFFRIVLKKIGE